MIGTLFCEYMYLVQQSHTLLVVKLSLTNKVRDCCTKYIYSKKRVPIIILPIDALFFWVYNNLAPYYWSFSVTSMVLRAAPNHDCKHTQSTPIGTDRLSIGSRMMIGTLFFEYMYLLQQSRTLLVNDNLTTNKVRDCCTKYIYSKQSTNHHTA